MTYTNEEVLAAVDAVVAQFGPTHRQQYCKYGFINTGEAICFVGNTIKALDPEAFTELLDWEYRSADGSFDEVVRDDVIPELTPTQAAAFVEAQKHADMEVQVDSELGPHPARGEWGGAQGIMHRWLDPKPEVAR